jgi:hypothetical protein
MLTTFVKWLRLGEGTNLWRELLDEAAIKRNWQRQV